jgi:membrane peptidoglycan carboxypeptidase
VLAHVGGDPRASASGADAFDRVRQARRQPGSAVKPLVLLEAFDDCGRREPVYPARRVSDRPLTLDLPSGPWSPDNSDSRFRGTVDLREALVSSLNVPIVRLARWCGFDEVSGTFERAGLELPDDVPPSFVLGAVEVSPAELAGAYTAFADYGVVHRPLPVRGIARPGGRRIARLEPHADRVADPAAAFLVRDLLRDAVTVGTARSAAFDSLAAFGKTGTSSDLRDAWLAGGAGSVVTVVWVGVDDGSPLGFSGSTAAAPIWSAFMERAAPARPSFELPTPEEIVVLQVQNGTGLLVGRDRRDSHSELFDERHLPRKRRLLLPDAPVDVIE